MTRPKSLDPYTSARTFYGSELRRLREGAELSQEGLGERAFCSGTYVGQFEAAVRRPQVELSKAFDEIMGSGEHLQRLCWLARKSKHPDYFADAAELEKLATAISEYAPILVPGLLQTEAYACAVTRAAHPLAPDEETEGHVQARMERQRILEKPTHPLLWVILYDAVLRVPMGGPSVMASQLTHIAQLSRARRVVVQVLPYAAATVALMGSMAAIMSFDDAPPAVYSEGGYTGQLIEEPTLVALYQRQYDFMRAAALSPTASLDLLESVAKDYETS